MSSAPAASDSGRARLRAIIEEKSLMRGNFTLASGRPSNFLFDMKKTMLDPKGINLLADAILEKTAGIDASAIGGLAMGAVPIVIATILKSQDTRRPLKGFWVRKEQKDHGTKASADGYIESGARVIVVEDVTTTGESVLKAVAEAKGRGCEIAAVVTILDRLEGARERLAAEGIDLLAVFTKQDFGL
ncbi:MAG TPA: orotate phosphoribosyltransferase [Alphaproteobacteria bacterium]|nr:orotate phosphoribosyltransferase [Alphaproteobacteria bacterium]